MYVHLYHYPSLTTTLSSSRSEGYNHYAANLCPGGLKCQFNKLKRNKGCPQNSYPGLIDGIRLWRLNDTPSSIQPLLVDVMFLISCTMSAPLVAKDMNTTTATITLTYTENYPRFTRKSNISYNIPNLRMSIGNKFTTILQTLISQKESNNITTSRCCSPLISMASKLTTEHAKPGNVTSNWTHPHIEKILGCLVPKKRQIWIVLIQKGKRKLTLIWSVPPRAVSTSSSDDV